jgi:uncharacterized membrane protein
MTEHYAIGAPDWIVPAAAIGVVLLLVVCWSYLRAPTSPWTKACGWALKVLALAAIAACLVEPLASGTRPRPQANIMAVLVDNSQSMLIGGGLTAAHRRERLLENIRPEAAWRERLEQDFDVRDYAFDTRLFACDDYTSLAFDGYASSLAQSLETIGDRYRHRPVAGLLLFSDGKATDAAVGQAGWEELGFPVYPVVEEVAAEVRDLAISAVSVNQSDFEAAPVTLQVEASGSGLDSGKIVAQLAGEGGKLLEEQVVPAAPAGMAASVRFRFRPEESGLQFYRVSVFPESQRENFAGGESGVEATLANNARLMAVQGRRGPYRVLYVAGRPNWEFKFLRRSLQEDEEIELTGLVRMARKEPKFSFQDFHVDSTNPIYRGFDEGAEDTTEQFDEPVLLKFYEGEPVKAGFPKTADELFAYHAVVLDDLEAEFFTEDQMLLLRRFVATRGGGLLILGGPDTFGNGKYERTPLAELSPVFIESSGGSLRRVGAGRLDAPGNSYRVALTREGWLEPWMRLRDTEDEERQRLAAMPGFSSLSQVGRVKAGAFVLATVEGAAPRGEPAMVVQKFGKGRSGALLVGDLWRWAMRQEEKDNHDLAQAWRQLIRWMVSEAPRTVELAALPPDDPSRPVAIEVRVHDPEYLPLDNATVELTIRTPAGEELNVSAEPSEETAGLYTASYWPRQEGGYRVEAVVTAPDGSKLPRAHGGWTAEPAAAEFRSLAPDREALEELAARTGGEVVPVGELDRFVASLPNRQVPVSERWVYPIWHQSWVLAFAIGCLCAEWGLRRWRGLP